MLTDNPPQPMRVGIIGTGERAAARAAVLRATPGLTWGGTFDVPPDDLALTGLDAFLHPLDAVFVAVPTAIHARVAAAAARQGVHFFVEWPPAPSLRECEAMLRLAEEAGVEAGVSRPLRFHPLFAGRPPGWKASLIVLAMRFAHTPPLADAVDLCCALARSGTVQRVDAEAVRGAGARLEAAAFTLRFHSGALAQASLHRHPAAPALRLFAGGGGTALAVPSENDAATAALDPLHEAPLREAETRAFLTALAERRPPPVTLLDGLHTLRLVERLMARLR